MHPNLILFSAILLWLSSAVISSAEQVADAPPLAEAGQDLSKQILGYWVVDIDSAKTKAFFTALTGEEASEDGYEELKEEMAATTFEFKEGQMAMHDPGHSDSIKITVKSQDLENRILVADFQNDDEKPVVTTLHITDEVITLSAKDTENRNLSFDLKRIDEETFKKRVPEKIEIEQRDQDQNAQAIDSDGGYPTATPVPDKPGFVFSPYNQNVVDVRDIPSGTLIADPHFPANEKKYLRAP
jgi:hypothetical protein